MSHIQNAKLFLTFVYRRRRVLHCLSILSRLSFFLTWLTMKATNAPGVYMLQRHKLLVPFLWIWR